MSIYRLLIILILNLKKIKIKIFFFFKKGLLFYIDDKEKNENLKILSFSMQSKCIDEEENEMMICN